MSSIDMTHPEEARIDWRTVARTLSLETRPFIDGAFVESTSPERILDINPATESLLVSMPAGSVEDVDAAVKAGRRAFVDGRWSRLAPQARRDVLVRFERLFCEHRNELALLDCLDVGKPITQALAEVEMACGYLRFAAEACDKLSNDLFPSDPRLLAFNVLEPVGVVGAIVPWNFPMVVVALKIAPALACGNSVVLKPSELSPLSALRIAALALEAGLPPGILNIVPGAGAPVGRAIAEHPDVDMLTFTGSTATGLALLRATGASTLKKLVLECGGKSPHIVFEDASDLDVVADDVVEQITWNQGQVCIASSRLLVQCSIHAQLVERVVTRMRRIQPGDPMDPATTFGPLVSRAQLDKVAGYVNAARRAGVRLLTGGSRPERKGFYFEPTVFDEVAPEQKIAREEIFGPVLSTFTFKTPEEAVRIANSST
ncbi:MAG: aldehyde dehydrogenase family protein, partial [Mycobacteriales bacterium]